MPRKKSRSANRAPVASPPSPETAVVSTAPPPAAPAQADPSATAIAPAATAPRLAKTAARKQPERAWVELVVIRLARILGSLQLAVILLILFTLAVFLGTITEHWYQAKIAQTLVYKAWWFVVLLVLLALNIFFAAAKKWPWKKYQTGFLITHAGLLTMLAGGMWHWAAGTDAGMQLIDTDDPQLLNEVRDRYGYIARTGTAAVYNDINTIRVVESRPDPHARFRGRRQDGEAIKTTEEDFDPGPLAWKSENPATPSDTTLQLLSWVQSPLGRHWSVYLGGGARLEVLDYLPFARREDYSPATGGFGALKLQLSSDKFPRPLERWVGANRAGGAIESSGMPIMVELLGTCPEPFVKHFLNPPAPEQLGSKGTLLVADPNGGERLAIPIDDLLSRTHELPGTPWAIKGTRYLPDWRRPDEGAGAEPVDPAVEFELFERGKSIGTLQVQARACDVLRDPATKRTIPQGALKGFPVFWMDPANPRGGREGLRGLLQFVQTKGGALYYRSFAVRDGKFAVEKSGPAAVGADAVPIWGRMQWKFRVQEHLPSARDEVRYTPAPVAPGKDTEEDRMLYRSAILCRVSAGGEHKDVWVSHQGGRATVEVGDRQFDVYYTIKQKDLKFEIKLERAEQTVDPGTRAPATYSSFVQIFDPEQNVNGARKQITMNEPLEHRGYKFYQSSYNFLGVYDPQGRPVSISGFTVGRDPGLWLKYLGSLMLGLGIFCMFYMKAYFFKPRRRPALAAAAPAPPSQPTQEG